MKNPIFGLKKRQDFWTEIILFFTFQVIVHRRPRLLDHSNPKILDLHNIPINIQQPLLKIRDNMLNGRHILILDQKCPLSQ